MNCCGCPWKGFTVITFIDSNHMFTLVVLIWDITELESKIPCYFCLLNSWQHQWVTKASVHTILIMLNIHEIWHTNMRHQYIAKNPIAFHSIFIYQLIWNDEWEVNLFLKEKKDKTPYVYSLELHIYVFHWPISILSLRVRLHPYLLSLGGLIGWPDRPCTTCDSAIPWSCRVPVSSQHMAICI